MEIVIMRSNIPLTLFILCYLLPCFISALQVSYDVSHKYPIHSDISSIQDARREKREIESFDNEDYPSAVSKEDQAEEPGFWDRIVKVALKLFNRFIEWLNSS